MRDSVFEDLISKINIKIDNYTNEIMSLCTSKKKLEKLKVTEEIYNKECENMTTWNHYRGCVLSYSILSLVYTKDRSVVDLFDEREKYIKIKRLILSIKNKTIKNCYYSFDFINELLDEFNLNGKEVFYVYQAIIENNIENGIFDKKARVLPKNVGYLRYASISELQLLIDYDLLDLYMNEKFIIFTKDAKAKKEYEDILTNKTVVDDDIMKLHECMNKFILEEYTYEDIDDLIDILGKYIEDKKSLNKIKIMFEKKLEPEVEEESHIVVPVAQNEYKEKEKIKEDLRSELLEYIDLKTMEPICQLNVKNVYRVLEILRFLEYDEESIKEFLVSNERNVVNMDTISKFRYLRGRFDYYKEKYGLVSEVKNLNDYYEEYEKSCEEDKKFYLRCLRDSMDYILRIIPSTFDYELKKINYYM